MDRSTLRFIDTLWVRALREVWVYKTEVEGLPGGSVVKSPPASAGDKGSISGLRNPMCLRATKPIKHNN